MSRDDPCVGVLGLGHVGLPTALGLAEMGWSVVGTDNDSVKTKLVGQGTAPFYEPGLSELLQKHLDSGRFHCVADVSTAVKQADVLFICVGTPQRDDGGADLSQVESAVRTVADSLNGYKVIVEKSTAPIFTARWIQKTLRRYCSTRHEFDIACNPEFLREGTAVWDFLQPDRIVIGVESERARCRLEALYRPLGRPILFTDLGTAEAIKHAANAFLALKISFINMVSDLCEATNTDVTDVARGLGLDPRIGPQFLNAGIGFGGYCLPKDARAFLRVAEDHGVDFSILREALRINDSRADRLVEKIYRALWVLKDKQLSIWGLSFKPETDDVREAPSIKIITKLLEQGARLRLYDPQAVPNVKQILPEVAGRLVYTSTAFEAARGADAIVILTEWQEFRDLNWKDLRQVVALPVVVDGRNWLDPSTVETAGFEYYGIGRRRRRLGPRENP